MKTLSALLACLAGIGTGSIFTYLFPAIIPSLNSGTKINGDEISVTKRKGLFSTVTYEISKDGNAIHIYNYNRFSKNYGLTNLRDYNKDGVVDEIYFSDNPLTENTLKIKRTEKCDFHFFEEADKIYKEQIKRFDDEK